jgi:hypothetical protein
VGFPRGAVSSPNTLDEDTGYVNLNATSPCSGLIASVHIAVFSRDNRIRLPPMSISVFRTQYVNGNGNLVTLARISSPQKLPVDNITQNSFFTGDNNLISLQLTLNPDSYIMISKGDVLSFELGEIDEGDEVRPLSGLPQGRNDRVRLIAERLVGFDNQLIGSIFGPSLGTPPVISATVGEQIYNVMDAHARMYACTQTGSVHMLQSAYTHTIPLCMCTMHVCIMCTFFYEHVCRYTPS